MQSMLLFAIEAGDLTYSADSVNISTITELLFTPFSVTRFAMHRIYANRINSRGISRVFCDLRSQKTPRGILPVNSNSQNSFQIACGNGVWACMSRDSGV